MLDKLILKPYFRDRSANNEISYRTIFLGLLAFLLAMIYGLYVILEVPAREVAILFFVACFFVVSSALLGLLFSFLEQ